MRIPLADRIRPSSIDEVVGQSHLIGKGKILYEVIQGGEIPNLIFYGPSGVGKTTVANIIAAKSNKKLYKLNATTCSVSDIKNIIAELDTIMTCNGVILYLDEIQNFNKRQQQSLLEVIENGKITLIASTTENPYFYIYNALLSRCCVYEFKALTPEEIEKAAERAIKILEEEYKKEIEFEKKAITHLANTSGGDVRKCLNGVEMSVLAKIYTDGKIEVSLEDVCQVTQKTALKYDKDGDNHYDLLSAFQKSIRGSDPDAAIFYLAKLILSGDLMSICRRLMVIASEDIGLAYPMASVIVKSCCDSAFQLGFPEARIPLANATLTLANAPKSNSAINAIDSAISLIEREDTGEIPAHIKDAHYSGASKLGRGLTYKYPHAYENHYVKQQYLPDKVKDEVFYVPADNKNEMATKEYWEKIKK